MKVCLFFPGVLWDGPLTMLHQISGPSLCCGIMRIQGSPLSATFQLISFFPVNPTLSAACGTGDVGSRLELVQLHCCNGSLKHRPDYGQGGRGAGTALAEYWGWSQKARGDGHVRMDFLCDTKELTSWLHSLGRPRGYSLSKKTFN